MWPGAYSEVEGKQIAFLRDVSPLYLSYRMQQLPQALCYRYQCMHYLLHVNIVHTTCLYLFFHAHLCIICVVFSTRILRDQTPSCSEKLRFISLSHAHSHLGEKKQCHKYKESWIDFHNYYSHTSNTWIFRWGNSSCDNRFKISYTYKNVIIRFTKIKLVWIILLF